MSSPESQPHITRNDLHSLVSICAVFFLVLSIVFAFGRIFTKTTVTHTLNNDDILILASIALFGAQTATVLIADRNGLGEHWEVLDESKRVIFAMTTYAAGLLYICTIVTTKLSITSFMKGLVPSVSHRKKSLGVGFAILAWGIASLIAASLQCSVPQPWVIQGNRCFNILSFWNTFNILNILTDLLLIVWPAIIVRNLRTTLKRRMLIIACFACRFLAIGTIIAELVLVNQVTHTSDPSFDVWSPTICTQLIQAVSIATACVPYLKPFLESFESGLLGSDDLRRRGKTGHYGYGTPHSSKSLKSRPSMGTALKDVDAGIVEGMPIQLRPMDGIEHATSAHATDIVRSDAESTSSQSRFIKCTKSYTIDTEPIPGSRYDRYDLGV